MGTVIRAQVVHLDENLVQYKAAANELLAGSSGEKQLLVRSEGSYSKASLKHVEEGEYLLKICFLCIESGEWF